jgi:ABC-type polysaccharide/polyol phosphate transport system ATPase subunit
MVVVQNVSKTFQVPDERRHTLKERVLHPRRRIGKQTFHALRDVSFQIEQGEFFGIAGRNGSGKSTLLKCLAGIYQAEGNIWRRGRMSTLIELGVGFNPDLAARDNVVLNGIMMGLTPREARRRYQQVIEFAELEEFQDLKLKNYSSGMHVRLAFSVAIQVDADLILIDEILAVGDAAFQQKCFDVINQMRDDGKTVVFVSHDMSALHRFCHRALLLERGAPVLLGDPQDVGDQYLELNFGREADAASGGGEELGDGDARVEEIWVEDADGVRQRAVRQNETMTLRVRVAFNVPTTHPALSIYILNAEHRAVTVIGTEHGQATGSFRAGDEALFSFSCENVLAPGRYTPMVNLAHGGTGLDLMDRVESSYSFVVTGILPRGGIVDLPTQVAVERVEPAVSGSGVSA